jgi:hypothetical protein
MGIRIPAWAFRASIVAAIAVGAGVLADRGEAMAVLATMTSGEISTLHAALFFALVWILSSLRIDRLRAFWRVGLNARAMRNPSGGGLLPGGPKARAAAVGSVSGAGASGSSRVVDVGSVR